MPVLELLDLLDISQRLGPPTQFSSWHLLAAFLIFCEASKPLGRYQLGEELELGGGSIRSLVRFFRNRNLIEPHHRQGHMLTPQGKHQCLKLRHVLVKFTKIPQSSFTVDKFNFGCHLRQLARYVTDGVQQRDAALLAGATGATTFIQKADPQKLIMPISYEIAKQDIGMLIDPFDLQENDVLIVGSGPSHLAARLGALAATLTLLMKT